MDPLFFKLNDFFLPTDIEEDSIFIPQAYPHPSDCRKNFSWVMAIRNKCLTIFENKFLRLL